MKYSLTILLVLLVPLCGMGQINAVDTLNPVDRWDNQMFISNKAAWSKGHWRYTGEFQLRLEEDIRQLQSYFLEGVATYMPNSKWEVVPDLRFTINPRTTEFRLGMGAIYKQYWEKAHKNQLAHQMKYQWDILSQGKTKHGFRYILFHTVVLNDKFMVSSAAGGFFRWSDSFTGVQFARAFTGLGYSFDKQHQINLSYFFGAENRGEHWSYIGGPILQLVIRFDDEYKYVPAKYISF